MSLVQFPRCRPSLMLLEDRCTPALFTVFDDGWNPATNGTLPWAIEQANSPLHPGLDIINFRFAARIGLGPKPTLIADSTLNVTEGVKIIGANGDDYVTIKGVRPFNFTHSNPAAVPLGEPGAVPATTSLIERMTFSKCAPSADPADTRYGGAIQVTGGTLTLTTARFLDNTADNGGAVFVGQESKLVVDGEPGSPTDYHPLQLAPRTLFKGNTVPGFGGAVLAAGEVELRRAWFVMNTATFDGGGLHTYQGGVVTTPSVPVGSEADPPDVRFASNEAGGSGGGVFFNGQGESELHSVVFIYNKAGVSGGGFAVRRGTVFLDGGSVEGNQATQGAGGDIEGTPFVAAIVNANGVSFSGNVDLLGNECASVFISDWGFLNTSGCFFNGWAPDVLPGITIGGWTSDGTDTP